jgi:hypothetical protein
MAYLISLLLKQPSPQRSIIPLLIGTQRSIGAESCSLATRPGVTALLAGVLTDATGQGGKGGSTQGIAVELLDVGDEHSDVLVEALEENLGMKQDSNRGVKKERLAT